MDFITLLVVAVALGTDAFSMAIGIGACGIRVRDLILASLVIMLFHIIMPLFGLQLGSLLGAFIGRLAEVLGALVLVLIGVLLAKEGFGRKEKEGPPLALRFFGMVSKKTGTGSRLLMGFWPIVLLSFSVSLDALTVGFGLGVLQVDLFTTVMVMGLTAGIMAAVGFTFGKRLKSWIGDRAQLFGGIILVAIGLNMLFF